MNITDIIILFQHYLDQEIQTRKQRLPYACCLSTIGLDGFPNARFVSLKEVRDGRFIVSGTLSSRKGDEIQAHHQVALTFWWPETQRQVRIQGIAQVMEGKMVDQYFNERNLGSRIVSVVSDQGKVLDDLNALTQQYEMFAEKLDENSHIPRPENWGAYAIEPIRIEFLTFSESRFHDRSLFQKDQDNEWKEIKLQP